MYTYIKDYIKKVYKIVNYALIGCRRKPKNSLEKLHIHRKIGLSVLPNTFKLDQNKAFLTPGPIFKINKIMLFLIENAFLPAVTEDKNCLDRIRERYINSHHPESCKRFIINTVDNIELDTFVIFNLTQKNLPANKQKWIVYLNGNNEGYENEIYSLYKISLSTGANIYTGNYRGVGRSKDFQHLHMIFSSMQKPFYNIF